MTKHHRLLAFDLLRVFGILIILFHHLPEYTFNYYNLNLLGVPLDLSPLNELNRYLGLGLFIFLSGYLLNLKKPRFTSLTAARVFLQKRWVRIFPLYYLALLLFIGIHHFWNPVEIGLYALGLQAFFHKSIDSPLPTLWFIGLIVVYYSFFVLLMSAKWQAKQRLALALGFGWGLFLIGQLEMITDFRLALYIWVFLLGIYTAEVNFFQTQAWIKGRSLAVPIFIVMLMFGFAWESQQSLVVKAFPSYLYVNGLMVSFIFAIYHLADLISKRWQLPAFVVSISYGSYCIYLFHRPLLWFMKAVLRNVLDIESGAGLSVLLLTVGVAIIFGVSYGVQNLYDRYGLQYFSQSKG